MLLVLGWRIFLADAVSSFVLVGDLVIVIGPCILTSFGVNIDGRSRRGGRSLSNVDGGENWPGVSDVRGTDALDFLGEILEFAIGSSDPLLDPLETGGSTEVLDVSLEDGRDDSI